MWPMDNAEHRRNLAIVLFVLAGMVLTGFTAWQSWFGFLGTLGGKGFVLFGPISVSLVLGLLSWYMAYVIYKMRGL